MNLLSLTLQMSPRCLHPHLVPVFQQFLLVWVTKLFDWCLPEIILPFSMQHLSIYPQMFLYSLRFPDGETWFPLSLEPGIVQVLQLRPTYRQYVDKKHYMSSFSSPLGGWDDYSPLPPCLPVTYATVTRYRDRQLQYEHYTFQTVSCLTPQGFLAFQGFPQCETPSETSRYIIAFLNAYQKSFSSTPLTFQYSLSHLMVSSYYPLSFIPVLRHSI